MGTIASSPDARVAVRWLRERVIQTLWFECLGLAIVSLPFAHFSGATVGDSLMLLAALSLVLMLWAGLYNTVFDGIECRLAGRVASERSPRWRVLHALGLEASALMATWPMVVALTELTWRQAFVAEIGLTLAYAAYGYCFHLAFDRVRPVHTPQPRRSTS